MINFKYLVDSFPENKDQAEQVWWDICSSLSPECIHEDGEISNAQADRKFRSIHHDARLLSKTWSCPKHVSDSCDDDISMYVKENV